MESEASLPTHAQSAFSYTPHNPPSLGTSYIEIGVKGWKRSLSTRLSHPWSKSSIDFSVKAKTGSRGYFIVGISRVCFATLGIRRRLVYITNSRKGDETRRHIPACKNLPNFTLLPRFGSISSIEISVKARKRVKYFPHGQMT